MSAAPSADLLQGAKAIGNWLGWKERTVRHVVVKRKTNPDAAPIVNLPGVGVCAYKSQLAAWLKAHGLERSGEAA
ncbi:MAG: hypothetical protein GC191_09335 [Azospirillum sp.]|nr:hypothetical protein [Azospirillum sp.]